MKYILIFMMLFQMMIPQQSKAGMYDSSFFEPVVGGLVIGGVMYSSAKKGEEGTQAGIGFVAGALIFMGANSWYRKKVDRARGNQREALLNDINDEIRDQAERAYRGVKDKNFTIMGEEVIEGQKTPHGHVSPTKAIILKGP